MEGGTQLIGCKICVKVEKISLEWFVKNCIRSFIVTVKINNTVGSETSTQANQLKEQEKEKKLDKWKGKGIYGQ